MTRIVSCLVLAACGSKSDDALSKLEGFRDRICECTQANCVAYEQAQMLAWIEGVKLSKDEVSDDHEQRALELAREIEACTDRIEPAPVITP